jgi:hypothetical protein
MLKLSLEKDEKQNGPFTETERPTINSLSLSNPTTKDARKLLISTCFAAEVHRIASYRFYHLCTALSSSLSWAFLLPLAELSKQPMRTSSSKSFLRFVVGPA